MRIVVTHTEPELSTAWRQALEQRLPGATVRIAPWPDNASMAKGPDYAVGWAPPAGFFEAHPGLQAFFSAAAGVEHVLRNPGLPATLPVVRLEDAGMGLQMVEFACHEVFRLRGRHADYERQQRECVWRELAPMPREQLRIGVFGLGVLGTRVAQALASFEYPVAGYSRTPRQVTGIRSYTGASELEAFLARTDVLILLAPLTEATRGILDARRLALLPKGAWLINLARGGLVDDNALLAALDSGQLAGASLDVFSTEPLPADHRYWRHPKVRLTPHISALTLVPEGADQVVAKIAQLESGQPVSGCVDRALGY